MYEQVCSFRIAGYRIVFGIGVGVGVAIPAAWAKQKSSTMINGCQWLPRASFISQRQWLQHEETIHHSRLSRFSCWTLDRLISYPPIQDYSSSPVGRYSVVFRTESHSGWDANTCITLFKSQMGVGKTIFPKERNSTNCRALNLR